LAISIFQTFLSPAVKSPLQPAAAGQSGFAAAAPCGAWSPRLAIRIFSNMFATT